MAGEELGLDIEELAAPRGIPIRILGVEYELVDPLDLNPLEYQYAQSKWAEIGALGSAVRGRKPTPEETVALESAICEALKVVVPGLTDEVLAKVNASRRNPSAELLAIIVRFFVGPLMPGESGPAASPSPETQESQPDAASTGAMSAPGSTATTATPAATTGRAGALTSRRTSRVVSNVQPIPVAGY